VGEPDAVASAEIRHPQGTSRTRMFHHPDRLKSSYDAVIVGGGGVDWQQHTTWHGIMAHNIAVLKEVTSAMAILDATPRLFAPTILRQKV